MFEHETSIEDYDAMSSELEMILLTLSRGCTCVRERVQYSYSSGYIESEKSRDMTEAHDVPRDASLMFVSGTIVRNRINPSIRIFRREHSHEKSILLTSLHSIRYDGNRTLSGFQTEIQMQVSRLNRPTLGNFVSGKVLKLAISGGTSLQYLQFSSVECQCLCNFLVIGVITQVMKFMLEQ